MSRRYGAALLAGMVPGALLMAAALQAAPGGQATATTAPAARLAAARAALDADQPAAARDQLLAIGAADAEALFWLSGAYRALKDYPAAQRSLDGAYRLDPTLRRRARELDRYGKMKRVDLGGCDDAFRGCSATNERCNERGCQTDYIAQQTCIAAKQQCYAANGR